MNGAVIGAGEDSLYAIRCAQSEGIKVIAFDENPLAEGLQYADQSFVLDIRRPELIIRALDKLKPDVVIPTPIGRCLLTAGAVNDHYGLMGISKKGADFCTDKYRFHQLLQENGLRKVSCSLIRGGG